jgi:hypothetical protein
VHDKVYDSFFARARVFCIRTVSSNDMSLKLGTIVVTSTTRWGADRPSRPHSVCAVCLPFVPPDCLGKTDSGHRKNAYPCPPHQADTRARMASVLDAYPEPPARFVVRPWSHKIDGTEDPVVILDSMHDFVKNATAHDTKAVRIVHCRRLSRPSNRTPNGRFGPLRANFKKWHYRGVNTPEHGRRLKTPYLLKALSDGKTTFGEHEWHDIGADDLHPGDYAQVGSNETPAIYMPATTGLATPPIDVSPIAWTFEWSATGRQLAVPICIQDLKKTAYASDATKLLALTYESASYDQTLWLSTTLRELRSVQDVLPNDHDFQGGWPPLPKEEAHAILWRMQLAWTNVVADDFDQWRMYDPTEEEIRTYVDAGAATVVAEYQRDAFGRMSGLFPLHGHMETALFVTFDGDRAKVLPHPFGCVDAILARVVGPVKDGMVPRARALPLVRIRARVGGNEKRAHVIATPGAVLRRMAVRLRFPELDAPVRWGLEWDEIDITVFDNTIHRVVHTDRLIAFLHGDVCDATGLWYTIVPNATLRSGGIEDVAAACTTTRRAFEFLPKKRYKAYKTIRSAANAHHSRYEVDGFSIVGVELDASRNVLLDTTVTGNMMRPVVVVAARRYTPNCLERV